MYTALHLIGWLLIRQPPTRTNDKPENIEISNTLNTQENDHSYGSLGSNDSQPQIKKVENVFPKDALRTKEFHLVYLCRFLITPITQVFPVFLINWNIEYHVISTRKN